MNSIESYLCYSILFQLKIRLILLCYNNLTKKRGYIIQPININGQLRISNITKKQKSKNSFFNLFNKKIDLEATSYIKNILIDKEEIEFKRLKKRNDLITISIIADFSKEIEEQVIVKEILNKTNNFIIKSGIIEIFQEEKEYILLMHYNLYKDKWDIKKEKY